MRGILPFFQLTAAALAIAAGGAAAEPLVGILPDTAMASVGDQVSVEIFVNAEIAGLMGWNVTVRFDPDLLTVDGVAEGALADESGLPTFFAWLNPGCACDSVCVNGSILGNTIDGPGALVRITFTTTQAGSADIEIARSDLRDGTNGRIDHDSENGTVVITATTGAATPGPAAGALTNFPNPFNPSTEMLLSLPGNAGERHTRLDILSVSGARVRSLFSGRLGGGRHRFVWDGRDERGNTCAGGVYVAVAEIAGERLTRKLVLAR